MIIICSGSECSFAKIDINYNGYQAINPNSEMKHSFALLIIVSIIKIIRGSYYIEIT